MRKVVALVALLGLVGWSLVDGRLVSRIADGLDAGAAGHGCVARAEPLCPLC